MRTVGWLLVILLSTSVYAFQVNPVPSVAVKASATNVLLMDFLLPITNLTDVLLYNSSVSSIVPGDQVIQFVSSVKHTENIAANNKYDSGESVYRDLDNDGKVTTQGAVVVKRGTQSTPAGASLRAFGATEKFADANLNNVFDDGELIVNTVSSTITVASIVSAGKVNLKAFSGEKHTDQGSNQGLFDTGESIYLDVDNDGVVSDAPDQVIDCDGDISQGSGAPAACPSVPAGASLVATGQIRLCTNSISQPSVVFQAASCTTDSVASGTRDVIGFPASSTSYLDVGNNWSAYDVNGNGRYDVGEPLYNENVRGRLTYTGGADTLISGSSLSKGTPLVAFTTSEKFADVYNTNKYADGELIVNSLESSVTSASIRKEGIANVKQFPSTMKYYDANTDARYSDGEEIINDTANSGIYSTQADVLVFGPAQTQGTSLVSFTSSERFADKNGNFVYDNESVIFDQDGSGFFNGDQLRSIKVDNNGTATDGMFEELRVYQDDGDGVFKSTDVLLGRVRSPPLFGATLSISNAVVFTPNSPYRRIFVVVDIDEAAEDSKTIQAVINSGNLKFSSSIVEPQLVVGNPSRIFIDTLAPNITQFTLSKNETLVGEVIQVTCRAVDSVDLDVSINITSIDVSVPGSRAVSCFAFDDAGNVRTKSLSYMVSSPVQVNATPQVQINATNQSNVTSKKLLTPGGFFKTFDVVEANHPTATLVSKEGVPVSRLEFLPLRDFTDAQIKIIGDDRPPVSLQPQGIVFKYVSIEHTFDDKDVRGVKLRFIVGKDWISENKVKSSSVVLVRLEGSSWRELVTKIIAEDTQSVVFESESPGLSNFAIIAKSLVVEKVVKNDSVVVQKNETPSVLENFPPIVEENQSVEEPVQEEAPKSSTKVKIIIGLATVLVVLLFFAGYLMLRQEEEV
jgi:PGF-pre-PGF domain-containing protein